MHTQETSSQLQVQRANPSHGSSIILQSQLPSVNQFSSIPRKHRNHKPINNSEYENARLARLNEVDFRNPGVKHISRAGIIPYTFIHGHLYMCFGQDRETGELTDFGGRRKSYETVVQCAVREGNEESRKVFGEIHESQVSNFLCLYSSKMLIIFVPVDIPRQPSDFEDIDIREITLGNFQSKEFLTQRQAKTYCYNELSGIVWLNECQIANVFSNFPTTKMFLKVWRFIYSCRAFSKNMATMKNILSSTFNQEDHTPSEQYHLRTSGDMHVQTSSC